MSTVAPLIESAFDRLSGRRGFQSRENQRQLSLLLDDLIDSGSTGAFEAPTGLGKSLAALIPAIAHAMKNGKRIVIATYTNVLAEQYWKSDLPLALSLFDAAEAPLPKTALLMGRSRYACLMAAQEHAPETLEVLTRGAKLGIESEFLELSHRSQRAASSIWTKIVSPPVCPARLCPKYDECFYYKARRYGERAGIVITNHAVVLSDALIAQSSEEQQSLLGDYDFLILDEAHDFPQAAIGGLEFELSKPQIGALLAVAGRVEAALRPLAQLNGQALEWGEFLNAFKERIARCETDLAGYGMTLGRPGIVTATPVEVLDHPHVKSFLTSDDSAVVKRIAYNVGEACEAFVKVAEQRLEIWKDADPEQAKTLGESIRNYGTFLREYGYGCARLFDPEGVAVSYVGRQGTDTWLRQDIIDLAEPLRELIWNRVPYACLSATLALDGQFDFYRRVTGAEPQFEEILPSPFDHPLQSAIYLPKQGQIVDPTVARKNGDEPGYYRQLAGELSEIITAMEGRTLALFHSRKEMEAVYELMSLPESLPLLIQSKFGGSSVGDKFKSEPAASLFALRSFWTGFDAPGETLSCVALVRIPFEVPVEPPQVARLAYLQTQERDSFRDHTLPNAKMLIRQGAGRLIRRTTDRGVIAILDPRIRTKNYGEEILANLPPGIPVYDDFYEAMAHAGLEKSLV